MKSLSWFCKNRGDGIKIFLSLIIHHDLSNFTSYKNTHIRMFLSLQVMTFIFPFLEYVIYNWIKTYFTNWVTCVIIICTNYYHSDRIICANYCCYHTKRCHSKTLVFPCLILKMDVYRRWFHSTLCQRVS